MTTSTHIHRIIGLPSIYGYAPLVILATNANDLQIISTERTPITVRHDTISFYDPRHTFGPFGQFISSYRRETIERVANDGAGLSLQGGIPQWTMHHSYAPALAEWLRSGPPLFDPCSLPGATLPENSLKLFDIMPKLKAA